MTTIKIADYRITTDHAASSYGEPVAVDANNEATALVRLTLNQLDAARERVEQAVRLVEQRRNRWDAQTDRLFDYPTAPMVNAAAYTSASERLSRMQGFWSHLDRARMDVRHTWLEMGTGPVNHDQPCPMPIIRFDG